MELVVENKQREDLLAESCEEFESIFNAIHDFVFLFSQDGKIIAVNKHVIQRLGFSSKELLGAQIGDFHLQEPAARAPVTIQDMLAGRAKSGQFCLLTRQGDYIPVETRIDVAKFHRQTVWLGISRDISEHRRVESVLKTSNEQLVLAIEGSGVGLWDWMIENGQLQINERWAQILGYTLAELAPVNFDTWSRLCHPDDLIRSTYILEEHFAMRTPGYECEVRMLHKDGTWVWVLDRGRVTEWDTNGKPGRITGTHLDITERRRMEEKLRYRLDFEALLTQMSTRFINVFTQDIDQEITSSLREIGEFEKVDRSYIFVTDYVKETMCNSHEWCAAGIEPQIDNLQDITNSMMPWWMSKLDVNEAIVINRVDDLPFEAAAEKEVLKAQSILSCAVVPLFAKNRLLGFAGFDSVRCSKEWGSDSIALLQQYGNILANLIQRRRVEVALHLSEERRFAILKAMPDNMFRLNQEGVILDFIASDQANLLLPLDRINGVRLSAFLSANMVEVALDKIRSAVQTGQKQTFEYELPGLTQAEHYEARIVACGGNEVIAIVRNVSERVRLEEMKSDFINRATHDLRTPITTILLMVRLLEGACSEQERDEYWTILKEELDRERVLIEDILTVGRLESNQWAVKQQSVNPFDIILASIQTVSPQAGQKNITINLTEYQDHFWVRSESRSLEQVLTNLLSNAIKFTPPEGKIDVIVNRQGEKGIFCIRDTGIGIPPEDISNLYTRFFRGRNAIDNEIQGSGIGLYIVKSMIEKFGGAIDIRSELGVGTCVEFWLPVSPEE